VIHRPRRMRKSQAMRELVAETRFSAEILMQPLFIREGLTAPREISAMPGVLQHTEQSLLTELDRVLASGVRSVMLFAVPEWRDETGSQATDPDGILNRSVRSARTHIGDQLVLVADLCLDEFTSHGHCGVLDGRGRVDNDATLERYADMAIELARAGADVLGASGMMDGQVAHLRAALDRNGFQDVAILAYAAKYASSFYGPFRDAVESKLQGDRKTYQQDFRNRSEALREIRLDLEQGADIVMVKPALAYLDIISDAAVIAEVPVAAYIVSGELAMIEAASAAGYINREAAISEVLHSVRRAGAQIICTYWATEYSEKLRATQ
jgi:porphobilinogen synthase